MKRVHYRWLGLGLILAWGLSGCSAAPSTADSNSTLVTVEWGSVTTSISAAGTVLPRSELPLSFAMAGQVAAVAVQEGERVKTGQVLARLESDELALQVRSAEAGLMAARARLDQLKAGARAEDLAAAQANLAAAQAALDGATAERQRLQAGATAAEIAAAEAQLAQAQAQQKAAEGNHTLTLACYDVPQPDGTVRSECPGWGVQEETTRYQMEAAGESLRAAQVQLEATRAGPNVYQLRAARANENRALAQRDAARAQLALLQAGATAADIAAAEASVAQAEVALETAQLALDRATLKAPADGIISQLKLEVGQTVAPQSPVVVLVDDSQFHLEVEVDEAEIGSVQPGQAVEITLDAFPGQTLQGQVTTIAATAHSNAGIVTYQVRIDLAPSELALRSGMSANAELIKERRENVLVIPNQAIWIDPDTRQAFVERQEGDQSVAVLIQQGLANNDFSEVTAGLQAGDRLVVRSASIRDQFRELVTSTMKQK